MDQRRPANWLLWGVLLLIVLAQTQCAVAKDPKDGPFVSGADLFAALLFGLWALSVLFTGAWRQLALPPLAAWALIGVAFLGLGRADSPEALKAGIVEVAQYALYFLCVYALFVNAIRDERSIRWVIWLLSALAAVMVIAALGQYILVADPEAPDRTFREVSSTFGVGEALATTSIGQKLHLAGRSTRSVYCSFLLIVLPIVYALGLSLADRPWLRAGLLAVVGVGLLTMLSGWQFWGLLAVLIALSVRHSVKTAIALAAAVVVFIGLSPLLFPRNYHAAIVEVMDFYETGVLDESAVAAEGFKGGPVPRTTEVKKRWIEWQPALMMMGKSPALGVGTGGYQLHIGQHYGTLPNFEKIEPDTNCGWLVIAASMGLCGLVALAALYYSGYRIAASMASEAPSAFLRAAGSGLAGSIVAMFLANIFSNLLVRGLSITMILLLALVTAIQAATATEAGRKSVPEEDEDAATEAAPASPNGG
jgi:hypothetical protein